MHVLVLLLTYLMFAILGLTAYLLKQLAEKETTKGRRVGLWVGFWLAEGGAVGVFLLVLLPVLHG